MKRCIKELTLLPNSLTPTLKCIHDLGSNAATFEVAMELFELAEQNLPSHDDVRQFSPRLYVEQLQCTLISQTSLPANYSCNRARPAFADRKSKRLNSHH